MNGTLVYLQRRLFDLLLRYPAKQRRLKKGRKSSFERRNANFLELSSEYKKRTKAKEKWLKMTTS